MIQVTYNHGKQTKVKTFQTHHEALYWARGAMEGEGIANVRIIEPTHAAASRRMVSGMYQFIA